jgi:hypothetical protein
MLGLATTAYAATGEFSNMCSWGLANRSMSPGVVDMHECGAAVQRTHSLDRKIVRSSVIIGDLVSRRNQCA